MLKNIITISTKKLNMQFVLIVFFIICISQTTTFLSVASRTIYLNKINVVCSIEANDKNIELITNNEVNNLLIEIPPKYSSLVLSGTNSENRLQRSQCIKEAVSKSKNFPIIFWGELVVDDNNHPILYLLAFLVTAFAISIGALLIKLFAIFVIRKNSK
jgi:hypothetical protein